MQIKKVTTYGDCEGRTVKILGYATGEDKDILAYYESQKVYELWIEPIKITDCSPDAAKKRTQLIKRQAELQKELDSIQSQLN